MKYRRLGKTGEDLSVIGFEAWNTLNLKYTDNKDEKIDEILKYGIENGINLIDTSYSYYPNFNKKGSCEEYIANFLDENSLRENVFISAKMPSNLIKSQEDLDRIFEEQLDNLKTEYIDFYSLDYLDMDYWNLYKSIDICEFLDKLKEEDKIKHIGFGTNCEMDMIVDITDDYDKWEFAISPLSYIDERYQSGLEGVEYLNKLGLGMMIRDPLRSNTLIENIPEEVSELWEFADKERTPLEWGLEYLFDKKEVNTVLFGLDSIEELEKYIEIAENIDSISQNDKDVLKEMAWEYKQNKANDCTGCKHCLPCPQNVDIPACFREYNIAKMLNNPKASLISYSKLKENGDECTNCGGCTQFCPQMINVAEDMQDCRNFFNIE